METITPILEQIRALIEPLNAQERLALIQAIAAIEAAPETATVSALQAEEAAWYAQPPSERQKYRGEFVALKDQQVIDHDADQRALYLRVKAKYGRSPIPILYADWAAPPTYTVYNPRLER
jgi:hypothetical protein